MCVISSGLPSVSGNHGVLSAVSASSGVAEEADAGVTFSVALPAGEGGRRSVSMEQESDAGVTFSVALPAGEGGRRSVSLKRCLAA